jgi:hypothetical protein
MCPHPNILIHAADAAVPAAREPLETKLPIETPPTPRHDGELSLARASPLEITVACAGEGGDGAVKEVSKSSLVLKYLNLGTKISNVSTRGDLHHF